MMRKITKAQALKDFRSLYNGPKGDTVMRSQAWNDYTDSLCRDRLITSKQYNTWTNPF
jgi:hypothetical protein